MMSSPTMVKKASPPRDSVGGVPLGAGVPVLNGVADVAEWSCGGYRFARVADYDKRVAQLPRLGGTKGGKTYPARKGRHVVTFRAFPDAATEGESLLFTDGAALHDVLALWSLVGEHEVVSGRSKVHWPARGELGYPLALPQEIPALVTASYGALRRRPVSRLVRSALLTYLEIAHVRPVNIHVPLLTSALECLAPISHIRGSDGRGAKYAPIVDRLMKLKVLHDANATREHVSSLIVALYRLRNEFLHSGVHPYREDIEIAGIKTNADRLARN